jgi:hypothetical protein
MKISQWSIVLSIYFISICGLGISQENDVTTDIGIKDILDKHLSDPWVLQYNITNAQQFLEQNVSVDFVPLLIDLINDDSNNAEVRVRAMACLTLADPLQAKETLVNIIEYFKSRSDKRLTKDQEYILYGSILWLGYTEDNELLSILIEMKEPTYWTELGLFSDGCEAPDNRLAEKLALPALYSIARLGTTEAESCLKQSGFVPDCFAVSHAKSLIDNIEYSKSHRRFPQR